MGCGTSKVDINQLSKRISNIPEKRFQDDNNTDNHCLLKEEDTPDRIKMENTSDQQFVEDTNKQTESNGVPTTEPNNDNSKDSADKSNEESTKQAEDQTNESQGQGVKGQEPKKLTPEEVAQKHDKKLAELQEKISAAMAESVYDDEGIPTPFFREKMLVIGKLYYALKGVPRKDLERYKQESAQMLLKTDFLDFICKYIIATLNERKYINSEGKSVIKFYNSLRNCLSMVLNYSDALPSLCERLCNIPGFLDCLRTSLETMREAHFEKEGTQLTDEDRLLKSVLGIIHNIGMAESCDVYLRNHDFTSVLLVYMDSRLSMCRLSSVAALADIVDEKESGLLQTKSSGIKFLIKIFGKSLKNELHKELGWSSWELARTVGRLARNDANKKMLVQEGVLPLLAELSKSEVLEEEKVALESLWVLAFDEDNKEKMMEEVGLMEMVVEKYRSSSDKNIRKPCQGILWNLRELLKSSEKYSDIGKEFSGHSTPKKVKGHVMMSYQWANQDLLKTVRDSLKACGYPVWMDIDNMGGSTLQAMAEAIENASVVLICMSQRYKDSPNCRAEAEYAFSQRKEIVPLLMDVGYRPDGWLGMILGSKLFFDFSGKYSFESRLEGLKKEVHQRLEGSERLITEDVVDTGFKQQPIAAEKAPTTFRPPPVVHSHLENVKHWRPEDVKQWLAKHSLQSEKLEKLTGKEVAFLKTVRYEAPEFFFRTLETKLGLTDLLGLVSFTEAMDNLTTK